MDLLDPCHDQDCDRSMLPLSLAPVSQKLASIFLSTDVSTEFLAGISNHRSGLRSWRCQPEIQSKRRWIGCLCTGQGDELLRS